MAQINVYSTAGGARVAVDYDRGAGTLTVGVESEFVAGAPDNPPHWESTGLCVPLDRDGCNNLIRAVREARDKAFGRDE